MECQICGKEFPVLKDEKYVELYVAGCVDNETESAAGGPICDQCLCALIDWAEERQVLQQEEPGVSDPVD
jgi:ribosomal protein L34E